MLTYLCRVYLDFYFSPWFRHKDAKGIHQILGALADVDLVRCEYQALIQINMIDIRINFEIVKPNQNNYLKSGQIDFSLYFKKATRIKINELLSIYLTFSFKKMKTVFSKNKKQ